MKAISVRFNAVQVARYVARLGVGPWVLRYVRNRPRVSGPVMPRGTREVNHMVSVMSLFALCDVERGERASNIGS